MSRTNKTGIIESVNFISVLFSLYITFPEVADLYVTSFGLLVLVTPLLTLAEEQIS